MRPHGLMRPLPYELTRPIRSPGSCAHRVMRPHGTCVRTAHAFARLMRSHGSCVHTAHAFTRLMRSHGSCVHLQKRPLALRGRFAQVAVSRRRLKWRAGASESASASRRYLARRSTSSEIIYSSSVGMTTTVTLEPAAEITPPLPPTHSLFLARSTRTPSHSKNSQNA